MLERPARNGMRMSARAAGERVAVVGEHEDASLIAIVAMAKNGPRRRKVGQEISSATTVGERRGEEDPEPRRDAEIEIEAATIGADREEHAMAERELSAEAADDVPGRREAPRTDT